MGVTLSYKQVYGSVPIWDDLQRALNEYSLEYIVDIISRISASLYATLPWDGDVQRKICQALFGPVDTARVIETAKRVNTEMRRDHGPPPPLLIFHEQQELNLLKAALLLKSPEDRDSSQNPVNLGKALLMITDLTEGEPGDLTGIRHDDPDFLNRWLGYILANGLFNTGSVSSYALARSYDLYLRDKPWLRNCGSYVDLPAVVQQVTGLDPDSLWAATFALATHWRSLSVDRAGNKTTAINRNIYFTSGFSFTDNDANRFFSTCTTDVHNLRAEVMSLYTLKEIRPFDMLPFAKCPLVAFDERVRSMSVMLLMKKLTTGLHYIHLDASLNKAHRDRYLTYMGEVFGDYVHRMFERLFPQGTGRYLLLDTLRPEMKGKYSDGVVAYPDGVMIVEVKASLFSLEARVGHKIGSIKQRLQDIYTDGAEQIQATIDALRNGLRDDQGVIPASIRWFLPVVVTLEDMPMNPITYGEIRRVLKSKGLLQAPDIRPLQSIDVGDLEQIEAVVADGRTLRQLFEEKMSEQAEAEDSWANFFYRRREEFRNCQNEYLKAESLQIFERAKRYFADRQQVETASNQ